jgi:dTMP kinase
VTGRFIALEGGEGTGKSTQAARLASRLDAVLTREPGGTAVGERIRALVLDPALPVAARTEALLMAAARAQHVAEVIAPALASGRHVVTDRFTGSSLAYQGIARGLGVEAVAALSAFATGGLAPDLVVLLDLPVDVASARLTGEPDRMEREDETFHAQVVEGFRSLTRREPQRWVMVDAHGTVDEVADAVWSAVAPLVG